MCFKERGGRYEGLVLTMVAKVLTFTTIVLVVTAVTEDIVLVSVSFQRSAAVGAAAAAVQQVRSWIGVDPATFAPVPVRELSASAKGFL